MYTLKNPTVRKNIFYSISILLASVVTILCYKYYITSCKEENRVQLVQEPKQQKFLFLEECKKKINNLEIAMLEGYSNKQFQTNELEILLAEKLTDEWDEVSKFKYFNNGIILINTIYFLLCADKSIEELMIEKNELLNMQNNTDSIGLYKIQKNVQIIEKKIEKMYIQKINGVTMKTIQIYDNFNVHTCVFVYLFSHFLTKSYNILPLSQNSELDLRNKIFEIISNDELGKIFKIYLLIEKKEWIKNENDKKNLLSNTINFFACFHKFNENDFFLKKFVNQLILGINKI